MFGALLGGLGLFLLGMGLMTDGLQAASGDSVRTALRRFTRTRWSAVATGAAATVAIQSSSATTLTTIGFVRAGLLTFPQAVGIVYGANVGTTATSWIVSTVGLKLDVTLVALPLVGIGALARLILRGRPAVLGGAAAGFGLLFVGIDVLQGAMADFGTRFDPAAFAGDGIWGRVLLVGFGFVMTVVMQSSSAAVATTLAAVHGGAIGLVDAAAVVIGQNLGTTVTALLGAAGASIPARRTAVAHVAFNVGTAVIAFALLPVFVHLVEEIVGHGDPAISLAAFHTAFNVLGVILFVPMTLRLVRFVERIVPDRGSALTRRLAATPARMPAVDVEAARLTTLEILRVITDDLARTLAAAPDRGSERTKEEVDEALSATREFLGRVRTDPGTEDVYRAHVAVLHALDHIHRLIEATWEDDRPGPKPADPTLADLFSDTTRAIATLPPWIEAGGGGTAPDIESLSMAVAQARKSRRPETLELAAKGIASVNDVSSRLDAFRWIDRVVYHIWRAVHHLEVADHQGPMPAPPAPATEGRRADESYDMG